MTVSWDEPDPPATTAGANVQPACEADRPLSARLRSPPKPFSAPTETVYDTPPPARSLRDDGVTDTVKSGGAGTTSVTDAVCTIGPLVAVIVSG